MNKSRVYYCWRVKDKKGKYYYITDDDWTRIKITFKNTQDAIKFKNFISEKLKNIAGYDSIEYEYNGKEYNYFFDMKQENIDDWVLIRKEVHIQEVLEDQEEVL